MAKREQFAVVFPDGLNRAWADLRPDEKRAGRLPPDGTDDVAFVAHLIDKYVAEGIADPKRVYVTGLSNGGAMTNTLICQRADLFAGAASVIMNLTDEMAEACHPARPVPMLIMNGTADPLVPYAGGRGTSRFAIEGFWSTEKTVQFWRKLNGCEETDAASLDLDDRDPNDDSTVTRISSTCPQGHDVLLVNAADDDGVDLFRYQIRAARDLRVRSAEPRHRCGRNDLGVLQEIPVRAGALQNILPADGNLHVPGASNV